MLGVERLGLVLGGCRVDDVVPPHVAAFGPFDVGAGAPNHQDVFDRVGVGDRLVGGFLQRCGLAAPELPVGGDQEFGLGVIDAGAECGGGEAGEDHAVQHAQSRAGQHRDEGFRDHRQIDRDAVAGDQAQISQRVGGFAHLGLKIAVGQGAVFADPLALPVDGDPTAVAGFDVAVYTVVGDIQFAASEPFGKRTLPTSPAPRKTVWPKTVGWPARPRTPAGPARPVDTGHRGHWPARRTLSTADTTRCLGVGLGHAHEPNAVTRRPRAC